MRENFPPQIDHMRRVLESLRKETDALERKNIQFIRTVSEAQSRDIQATSDLYSMSTGGGLRVGDELPSLVDVAKCTSDKVRTSLLHVPDTRHHSRNIPRVLCH